jgi:hypothetical protein
MPVALGWAVSRPILAPALALVLLAACGFDPGDDSPMTPPAVYREWWAKTEACSGRSADFDRIKWSQVPGHSFPCASGQCAGHWESDHHIFIANDWTANEMVVRHEMLHDLLERSGHPDPPFGDPCPLTWSTWQGDAAADLQSLTRAAVEF